MMPLMRLALGTLIDVQLGISDCCEGLDVDLGR